MPGIVACAEQAEIRSLKQVEVQGSSLLREPSAGLHMRDKIVVEQPWVFQGNPACKEDATFGAKGPAKVSGDLRQMCLENRNDHFRDWISPSACGFKGSFGLYVGGADTLDFLNGAVEERQAGTAQNRFGFKRQGVAKGHVRPVFAQRLEGFDLNAIARAREGMRVVACTHPRVVALAF